MADDQDEKGKGRPYVDAATAVRLPHPAKGVLVAICAHADNDTGQAYPGILRIAAEVGIGLTSANKGVKMLKDAGLIAVVGTMPHWSGAETNLYQVNLEKLLALAAQQKAEYKRKRLAPKMGSVAGRRRGPSVGEGGVMRPAAEGSFGGRLLTTQVLNCSSGDGSTSTYPPEGRSVGASGTTPEATPQKQKQQPNPVQMQAVELVAELMDEKQVPDELYPVYLKWLTLAETVVELTPKLPQECRYNMLRWITSHNFWWHQRFLPEKVRGGEKMRDPRTFLRKSWERIDEQYDKDSTPQVPPNPPRNMTPEERRENFIKLKAGYLTAGNTRVLRSNLADSRLKEIIPAYNTYMEPYEDVPPGGYLYIPGLAAALEQHRKELEAAIDVPPPPPMKSKGFEVEEDDL